MEDTMGQSLFLQVREQGRRSCAPSVAQQESVRFVCALPVHESSQKRSTEKGLAAPDTQGVPQGGLQKVCLPLLEESLTG